MTGPLLERQARLLEYLTSGEAIFGRRRDVPLDARLAGLDRDRLDLEARFSHEKRMEKIAAVFPMTFRLLGDGGDTLVRMFANSHRPFDISRIENARQFRDFLLADWQHQPPEKMYLPDVVAFEMACAEARFAADRETPTGPTERDITRPAMRRPPGVVLLRTSFDIRAILGNGEVGDAPKRETLLAIACHDDEPGILELTPEAFDLLQALDRWTAVDGLMQGSEVLTVFADAGLLELRR